MDVLRHGPHVRVVDPPELVAETTAQLQRTLARYAGRDDQDHQDAMP